MTPRVLTELKLRSRKPWSRVGERGILPLEFRKIRFYLPRPWETGFVKTYKFEYNGSNILLWRRLILCMDTVEVPAAAQGLEGLEGTVRHPIVTIIFTGTGTTGPGGLWGAVALHCCCLCS